MNREILFRGKRIDNGKWVEGCLLIENPPLQCFGENTELNKYLIGKSGFADWNMPRPFTASEVLSETIGQFTGLTDKVNARGFEGDLCRWGDALYGISYNNGGFTLKNDLEELPIGVLQTTDSCGDSNIAFESKLQYCEIVGNIHDKPELLKNKQK